MRNKIVAGRLVLALTSILLVVLIMPAFAEMPHSAIVIEDLYVPHGRTASVSITITEDTNGISCAELDLLYDPAVITPVALTGSDFDIFISNEPTPGTIKMVAFQGENASLIAPARITDVTFKGIGDAGANTTLTIVGRSYMDTGSPYGDITLNSSSGYVTNGAPAFNTLGMIALVGLLALVLMVTARKKR
jgi:hypothetical protein